MKRLAIAVSLLAVGAAGCGSSTPTTPSTFKVFTVQISPANEVPAITGSESSGKGTAVITVHSDSNTVDFSINLNGFPANTTLTAAHIHPGAAGVNGGAQIGVPGIAGTVLANGSTTFVATGVAAAADSATAASRIQAILAAPQNFYFNVHTTVNGGGVARGQLQ
jgi:hypothetical protein